MTAKDLAEYLKMGTDYLYQRKQNIWDHFFHND